MSKKDDLSFGFNSEEVNLKTLQSFFKTDLKRQGGYATMDYTNDSKTLYIELKTRRIAHDQYPTSLIGINKVEFCSDPNKQYYFVFCYNDGIYYIQYDKALFDTFERNTNYWRRARTDCYNYQQSVIYIPIDKLSKIEI